MTINELRNKVEGMLNISVSEGYDGYALEITVHDFVGFTKDWDEEYQETDEKALMEVLNTLPVVENNLYVTYQLEDGLVQVGYTSFDI